MCMRSSDSEDKLHFRSDRVTCLNGLFYLNTREGELEGPYRTREHAEVAAALYVRYHLDPTRVESSHHEPDQHIYRYAEGEQVQRLERRRSDRRK